MSATTMPTTGRVYRLLDARPKARRAGSQCGAGGPSEQARAAWLVMRDVGGWWTAGELGRHMLTELVPAIAARAAARWLFALLRRGHVALHPEARRVKAYGVTARCAPFPGESMGLGAFPTSVNDRSTGSQA